MSQLAQLPPLTLEVCQNAVSPYEANTWTTVARASDGASYIRDFQRHFGKEHGANRVQAGTLSMTLDGRDGAVGGLGLAPRDLVRLYATVDSELKFLFYGTVQSMGEAPAGPLYDTDWKLEVQDLTRLLSTTPMLNRTLYSLCFGQSTYTGTPDPDARWWRFGEQAERPILSTLEQAAIENFVTALGTRFPIRLFPRGKRIPTDLLQADVLSVVGEVDLGMQAGVLLYDDATCADLTGGTGGGQNAQAKGMLYVPEIATSGDYAVDFWFIGQGLGNSVLFCPGGWDCDGPSAVVVDNMGHVAIASAASLSSLWGGGAGGAGLNSISESAPFFLVSKGTVNDGYWHHMAFICESSNGEVVKLYLDGQEVGSVGYSATAYPGGFNFDAWQAGTGAAIGAFTSYNPDFATNPTVGLANAIFCLPGYVDQIVATNPATPGTFTNGHAAVEAEILSRYQAGMLLRNDKVFPAQRLAEILTIAGCQGMTLYVDDSEYATIGFRDYTVVNASPCGTCYLQGQLSQVVDSMALDLIGYVEDTEGGIFFANLSGGFNFCTQVYPFTSTNATTVQLALSDNDTADTYPFRGTEWSCPTDDADLFTLIIIDPLNGIKQVYVSPDVLEFAPTTQRLSGTLHYRNEDAYDLCQRWGYYYGQAPLPRIVKVPISSEAGLGAAIGAAIVNVRVWHLLSAIRTVPGLGAQTYTQLVEQVDDSFQADPGVWQMNFQCDPYRRRQFVNGQTPWVIGVGVIGECQIV